MRKSSPRSHLTAIALATWISALPACGDRVEAVRTSPETEAETALLPRAWHARGSAIAAEPDPAERASQLRALAVEAAEDATAFVARFLYEDPSPHVRERAARSLRGTRNEAAIAALEHAASSDPDVGVVMRALDELHTIRLGRVLELVRARLALAPRSSTPESERFELLRAEEHWLTMARGGLLPAFLREPPPAFEVLADDRPIRVVAFGDFGSGESDQLGVAKAVAQVHAQRPIDLGITLGDNFYPRGVASLDDPLWRKAWVEPYAGLGIPFYASLGNHDWGRPGSPAAEILYREPDSGWHMPASHYTFTAGPAQFFALDTTALSQRQLEWLDAELDRWRATWRIVYGHHPIRSGGRYGDNDDLVARLLPVLRDRADLYLCGHEHDLQVLSPEDGVHFVVAGGGGKSIRETGTSPRTRFSASAFGFAVLEIEADEIRIRLIDRELALLYESSIRPLSSPKDD